MSRNKVLAAVLVIVLVAGGIIGGNPSFVLIRGRPGSWLVIP